MVRSHCPQFNTQPVFALFPTGRGWSGLPRLTLSGHPSRSQFVPQPCELL